MHNMKKTSPKKKVVVKKNTVFKKTVAEKVIAPKKNNNFTVSLFLAYETLTGAGETMLEALNQLPVGVRFKSKGRLLIQSEGKQADLVMQPIEITRLLSRELNKVFFQKRILLIMK